MMDSSIALIIERIATLPKIDGDPGAVLMFVSFRGSE
jgi:hypothetical protein